MSETLISKQAAIEACHAVEAKWSKLVVQFAPSAARECKEAIEALLALPERGTAQEPPPAEPAQLFGAACINCHLSGSEWIRDNEGDEAIGPFCSACFAALARALASRPSGETPTQLRERIERELRDRNVVPNIVSDWQRCVRGEGNTAHLLGTFHDGILDAVMAALSSVRGEPPTLSDDDLSDAIARGMKGYHHHFSSRGIFDEVHGNVFRELRGKLPAVRGETPAPDYKALYNELIYQVGNKHPGETRHQTALRYLRQAEAPQGEACAAPPARTKEGQ